MKSSLLSGLAALAFCFTASAAPVSFPEYGFEMGMLDASPGADGAQALISFLPPVGAFAPNVNVMIQPYAETMADYITLTKGQLEQMSLTLISDKSVSETEWIVEYTGAMGGNNLHWYARVVLSEGRVYLITATAGADSWEAVSETLKACVASFKLKAK